MGTRLTNTIKDGTANSDQLRTAIEKIGKSAAGGKGDIKQLTEAIDTVDDGTAIKNLIDDLKKAGEAAQQTADDVGEIQKTTKGEAMMQAADQLSVVGDKIKEVGTSAIDTFRKPKARYQKLMPTSEKPGSCGKISRHNQRCIRFRRRGQHGCCFRRCYHSQKKH